ncbi:MAG: hypothetical protein JWL61_4801 [Gemmatimonadetes bacterium]|nr:hypothetical protein [Gemmatimonadota bacterium]
MRTYALGALELTRRLVANAAAQNGATGVNARASHIASERACRDLSRSLGVAGFTALLTRALSQAELDHPLLKGIHLGHGSEPVLNGLDDLVAQHGGSKVDAGLESMLATMFGLLGRLIGEDMVPRLLERVAPIETHDKDRG